MTTRIQLLKAHLATDHMPDIFVMSAFLTLLQKAAEGNNRAGIYDMTIHELACALEELRAEHVSTVKATLKAKMTA